jgi:hypothetical protein
VSIVQERLRKLKDDFREEDLKINDYDFNKEIVTILNEAKVLFKALLYFIKLENLFMCRYTV